jgi:hypothetical protein
MMIQWNLRDLLRLTRDCDLGLMGTLLHVVKTDGPYMTVRVLERDSLFQHLGRDYPHVVKVGEGAVDRADKPPPWHCCASKEELVRFAHDVRAYFAARDEFDTCNLVAEPAGRRSRVAAKELEEAEAALRARGAIVEDSSEEPPPGWEDRAVERARREGLFDRESVPADVSDEGLITDNGPHLTIETLLPTSRRAFCVKCGEHVECDGAECPRCGFDTVVHDTDETED